MTAGTVVLWRHGQTDYNASGRLQGQVDIPLNSDGVRQATLSGTALSVFEPTRILTSDLSRARETAQALAERTGVEPVPDPRLRERSFGAWEGLTHPEMEQGWPEAYAQWRRGEEPFGVGAETRTACGVRVAETVRESAAELDQDDVLVVVAHGAAIGLGLTVLLDLDPARWYGISGLANCGWSLIHPNTGREPAWRLSAHNLGVD